MQSCRATRIIAGLGNHFAKNSRHSVGMRLCDQIAEKYACAWNYERKYKAYTASFHLQDQQFVLFKSKWPMNLNGKSLEKIVSELNIDVGSVVVLHDELDRGLGKFSWKVEGSANGHNGVKSVIRWLKTDKFRRLRIGIGRPQNKDDVVAYVLDDFTDGEEERLQDAITACIEMIEKELFPKPLSDNENEELNVDEKIKDHGTIVSSFVLRSE